MNKKTNMNMEPSQPAKLNKKKRSPEDAVPDPTSPKRRKSQKYTEPVPEKRLRRWRVSPPQSYTEIRSRALTQRMYVLDRKRSVTSVSDLPALKHKDEHEHDGTTTYPTETITLAGTTGNIYTVTIDRIPRCDCPHALKGNQCKHVVYVLTRVLRLPRPEWEYQLAFTTDELREIFEKAPALPGQKEKRNGVAGEDDAGENRKPLEGECPICCEDFDVSGDSTETIVYCRAACGNNIHLDCFRQWAAASQSGRGGRVTCPFCRSAWEFSTSVDGIDAEESAMPKQLARSNSDGAARRNAEGYVNVAAQLGMSGRRDYSTYHAPWVRRQMRRGNRMYYDDWEDSLG